MTIYTEEHKSGCKQGRGPKSQGGQRCGEAAEYQVVAEEKAGHRAAREGGGRWALPEKWGDPPKGCSGR